MDTALIFLLGFFLFSELFFFSACLLFCTRALMCPVENEAFP